MTPVLISSVAIYPREHYVVILLYLLFMSVAAWYAGELTVHHRDRNAVRGDGSCACGTVIATRAAAASAIDRGIARPFRASR